MIQSILMAAMHSGYEHDHAHHHPAHQSKLAWESPQSHSSAQWIAMSAMVRAVSQRGFSSWTHEIV